MQLDINLIKNSLDNSLREDLGIKGDITSEATIDKNKECSFKINTRQKIVVCGTDIAKYFLDHYSDAKYQILVADGNLAHPGETIISGKGNARDILKIERIILNYMQHMSGIASLTKEYVEKLDVIQQEKNFPQTRICDTRKTVPGLRHIQKYAVTCGGGFNHRLTLDSSIMIKDNHISLAGGLKEALIKAKKHNPHYAKIEVECDTIEQVQEAIDGGSDIIMLDNMDISQLKESISLIRNQNPFVIIEVSGGVDLGSVSEISLLGVDVISTSKITSAAPAVDIGLDIKSN